MKNLVIRKMQQRTQKKMAIKITSDFQRVLKRLLDSQILNDKKAVEEDLINDGQKFTIQLMLMHFKKDSNSNFRRSEAYKSTKCSWKEMRLYCSFVSCISYAKCDIYPYKEILSNLLDEVVKQLIVEKSHTCKFLFNLIFVNVNVRTQTLEKGLLNSILKMNDLLELSDFKNLKKAKCDVRRDFRVCLKFILSVFIHLTEQKSVLNNFNVAERFVMFYLKLYKTFKNKTYIEADRDLCDFELILHTIERSAFIFPSHKITIIKQLAYNWPTAFHYQVETIGTFLWVCDSLSLQKMETIKSVLLKKLNDLIIGSSSKICFVTMEEVSCKMLTGFWYPKCTKQEKKLIRNREKEYEKTLKK